MHGNLVELLIDPAKTFKRTITCFVTHEGRGNMLWQLFFATTVLAGCIEGEIVSVFDATPGKIFHTTLKFYIKRDQRTIKLFLLKNEPNRQQISARSIQMAESKSYKDLLHGGRFEVHLTKQNDGQYFRTLTGNFELYGKNVHIEPMQDQQTQQTRSKSSTPYVLHVTDKLEQRSLSDVKENSLLVRYLLARQAHKKANKNPARQFSSTPFPLPTIDMPPDASATVMSSPWTDSTMTTSAYSTGWTEQSSETPPWFTDISSSYSTYWTYMPEKTTYATKNPGECSDSFSECSEWLNDYYNHDLQTFCGEHGYDSWCCETCLDWESAPKQCKDDYNDCRELLVDLYDEDYDAFCPTWDDSCCATCAGDKTEEPKGECEDTGYYGSSCKELLDRGFDGDMEEMCELFDKECCTMCSNEHSGGGKGSSGRNGGNGENAGSNEES